MINCIAKILFPQPGPPAYDLHIGAGCADASMNRAKPAPKRGGLFCFGPARCGRRVRWVRRADRVTWQGHSPDPARGGPGRGSITLGTPVSPPLPARLVCCFASGSSLRGVRRRDVVPPQATPPGHARPPPSRSVAGFFMTGRRRPRAPRDQDIRAQYGKAGVHDFSNL